jgi:hypothetical protein
MNYSCNYFRFLFSVSICPLHLASRMHDVGGSFIVDMLHSGTMDSAIVADRILQTLKFSLAGRFLNCFQLAILVNHFPDGYMPCGEFSTYRVELIISLFSRLVDLINFDYVLKELESTEYGMILFRLGWLNVWNPLKAEGRVTLDLSRREERQLLRVFLVLNVAEPGPSWQDPTFRATRAAPLEEGWILPAVWYMEAALPNAGIVSFSYFSGRGAQIHGCAPNAAARHTLMALVLAKAYSQDVWSGNKPSLEAAEALAVKMECKLSFIADSTIDTPAPHAVAAPVLAAPSSKLTPSAPASTK